MSTSRARVAALGVVAAAVAVGGCLLGSRHGPRALCPVGGIRAAPPPPITRVRVIAAQKQAWERTLGGAAAAQPYIQARLRGWPSRVLVDSAGLPQDDRAFARRLARDTWTGLDALTDREHGLPVDNMRVARTSVAIADAHIGDYASGTNIGLHLIAIVAARELELLTDADALERIRRVLDTVARLETYQGFLFNFYDTTSLERTSNFVSFIDSAWLAAGLMVVRARFAELDAPCSALIARMDFRFFYDPSTRRLSHGYYVDPGVRSPYDYGMLYTEARVGSLIAIGKGDVPAAQWFEMIRTYPADCPGQTQVPQATGMQTVDGYECTTGYYEWAGERYVPSWGGSMFEALMPTLVLDELRFAPRSLGANDTAHARVQRRYALDTLGYPVWGLSPSAMPTGRAYGEYGVRVLGTRGYDAGAVTPHASALALRVTPDAALANLRTMASLYDIYGDYGFYDAVDPGSGRVAYTYLALDQSMLFVALANYLGDNCIERLFAADPITQRALPIIGAEAFFD